MAKYTPDRAGTRNYLQHSPQLRMELHRRALLGLSAAAALMHQHTGAMAASGRVQDDGPNGGAKGDRMQFSVTFDVGHAVPATWHDKPEVALNALRAAVTMMEAGR